MKVKEVELTFTLVEGEEEEKFLRKAREDMKKRKKRSKDKGKGKKTE